MTILQIIFYVTGILFFSCKVLSWLATLITNIIDWKENKE